MLRMNKIFIAAFIFIFVFAFAFAGGEKEDEQVVINELMFSGAAQEVLIDQADRYMKANPNVTVNITWTDYASLHEKMMTELVGGTGRFDVMAAITDFMPEFIGGLI